MDLVVLCSGDLVGLTGTALEQIGDVDSPSLILFRRP